MKILHVIPSISPPLGVPSEVARLKYPFRTSVCSIILVEKVEVLILIAIEVVADTP